MCLDCLRWAVQRKVTKRLDQQQLSLRGWLQLVGILEHDWYWSADLLNLLPRINKKPNGWEIEYGLRKLFTVWHQARNEKRESRIVVEQEKGKACMCCKFGSILGAVLLVLSYLSTVLRSRLCFSNNPGLCFKRKISTIHSNVSTFEYCKCQIQASNKVFVLWGTCEKQKRTWMLKLCWARRTWTKDWNSSKC